MQRKGEKTIRWTLPWKKTVPGDVAVIGPIGTKLSPWRLNPCTAMATTHPQRQPLPRHCRCRSPHVCASNRPPEQMYSPRAATNVEKCLGPWSVDGGSSPEKILKSFCPVLPWSRDVIFPSFPRSKKKYHRRPRSAFPKSVCFPRQQERINKQDNKIDQLEGSSLFALSTISLQQWIASCYT
jgi:hypothetical protein